MSESTRDPERFAPVVETGIEIREFLRCADPLYPIDKEWKAVQDFVNKWYRPEERGLALNTARMAWIHASAASFHTLARQGAPELFDVHDRMLAVADERECAKCGGPK